MCPCIVYTVFMCVDNEELRLRTCGFGVEARQVAKKGGIEERTSWRDPATLNLAT